MPPWEKVASPSCSSSSRGIQEEEPRACNSWDEVRREKTVTEMASGTKRWEKNIGFCKWWCAFCEHRGAGNRETYERLRMDLIPNPSDLFHPALPDSSVNFSQHGAWHCAHHNKKIRAERGVMSKRGKRHSTLNMETEVSLSKSLHMLPIYCHCFWICLSRCGSCGFIT